VKEVLYGLEKGGKIKVWEIETAHNEVWSTITVEYGEMGGKFTKQITYIDQGKQGRTIPEQADKEAQGKIKKQLDKNYRRTIAELSDLPLLPMLAMDYREHGHRIDYAAGVFVSDKLDGLRLVAQCVPSHRDIGKAIKLKSRTGQPYSIPHIEAELLQVMQVGEVFDGEAYLHGEVLQDITSAVKRTDTQAKIDEVKKQIEKHGPDYRKKSKKDGVLSPTLDEELENAELIQRIRPQLRFVIFDVPGEKVWDDRCDDLLSLSDELDRRDYLHALEVIRYKIIYSEEQMRELHKDAVNRGYEGVMLRNRKGLYESGKRSADLQKYKEFLDAEFLVTDYALDKEGQLVFVCRNDLNSNLFSVIFGSEAEKAAMLAVVDSYLQQYLKVKFQSRYKKTLLPQFPTGVMFRAGSYVSGEFVPDE